MGAAKVNIRGFLLTTSGASGWVRLVVDNVNNAKEALENGGLFYAQQLVLRQDSGTCPGTGTAGKLAAKDAIRQSRRTQNDQSCSKFLIWKKRSVFR
jgi:hypothetical protein